MKKNILFVILSIISSIIIITVYDFFRNYTELENLHLFFISNLIFCLIYKILNLEKNIILYLLIFSLFINISFYIINKIEKENIIKYYIYKN